MSGFSKAAIYRNPLLRGMLSYGLIWPTCSVIQEYVEYGTSLRKADWSRAGRFGAFGAFFMAPMLYTWMLFTNRFFKSRSLQTAMKRAVLEQVSFAPFIMACFFFGMSALEKKSLNSCIKEVKDKLWPTYLRGVVYWPVAQTLNFYFVRPHNRIIFASGASFIWTVYLSHVKSRTARAVVLEPSKPQMPQSIKNDRTD